MKVEDGVRAFAGVMILISVLLVVYVSKWWLLFTAFIGINLFQSAFTHFCPPSIVMKKLGMKERGESDSEGSCCGKDKHE